MSNPYIIGAALLGVGILGMWLLGPKKSPTQEPDRMPSLNSSMRGSTIFVSFGTNKISAQIGWTNNFQAIRQSGSGKGGAKGGGSGGFGSMKGGGAAGQSYIYQWDMLFTYGIMDRPSIIRQGWIGGDKIDQNDISALTGGDSDYIISIFPLTSVFTYTPAKLNYGGAFVARGEATGDPDLETWPHFATAAGVNCAWPYNAWVGFEQLVLGQSPSIPQLFFEFVPVPGVGGFTMNTAFASTTTSGGEGFSTMSGVGNCGLIFGEDGKHYYPLIGNTDGIHFVCVEDGTHITLLSADFQADLATKGMTPPTGTTTADYGVGGGCMKIPCNGTPYIWLISNAADGGFGFAHMGLRYKINASSALEIHGGCAGLADFITYGNFGQYAANSDGINVYAFGNASFGGDAVLTLPLTGDVTDEGADWTALFTPLHPSNDFFDILSNRVSQEIGCVVLQPDNSWEVLIYLGQAEYDYAVANPAHSAAYSDVTAPGVYRVNDGSVTLLPDFAVTDIKTHYDGSASSSYYDDYACAITSFIQNGVTFVAMTRGYSIQADNTPTGSYALTRLFTWDGSSGSETGVLEGSPFDTVADLGFIEGNRYNIIPPGEIKMWLDGNGSLRYVWVGFAGFSYRHVFGTFAMNAAINLDVTPAYMVYRIITSDVFGFATNGLFGYTITPERVNATSYEDSVQWCVDHGIYVSASYTSADNVLDILNELLALYQGFLVDLGGEIFFKVVTGVDTPEAVIDNSHLVADAGKPPVQIAKAATDDSYNIIEFSYLNRDRDYEPTTIYKFDEVDVDFNGPRKKAYRPRFTMTGSLAARLATRALWSNMYGKDQYKFQLGWKDAHLHQGALVTLVDSFDPVLSGGVRCRILKWKEASRGKFDVIGVREYPYIVTASADYTNDSSTDQGFGGLVQDPQALLDFRAYELPREFQNNPQVFFGYNQSFLNMGAQLHISHDGANYVLTQDTQPFIVSGLFPNGLEYREQGHCDDMIDFYLFPASGFSVATPTLVTSYNFDDITQALRAAGAGVFVVGSEAVAIENLSLLGQNHYRAKRLYRGWGGTPISSHAPLAYFHHHAAGMFMLPISEDDIGASFSYKIVGYNFAGDLFNISSIDARTYTVKGDYWLPRAQPRTNIYVTSAQAWPASVPITGPYIGVAAGGVDIALRWPLASNVEGFGAGGYGAGGYGHFAADSLGWRVDVKSINGTKVSSFLVDTPAFNYTQVQNSTDFAGFGRDLILSVTPYTVKGDGPVADTRSLSMNW